MCFIIFKAHFKGKGNILFGIRFETIPHYVPCFKLKESFVFFKHLHLFLFIMVSKHKVLLQSLAIEKGWKLTCS